MKVFLSLCLAWTAVNGFAAEKTAADENHPDRVALRKIRVTYEEAVNGKDISKLKPFVAAGATAVLVTGEEVKGYEGLEAYWAKVQKFIGPDGSYQVEVTPSQVDLYGDLAIARGTTVEKAKMGKRELQYGGYWTAICQKQNGDWKILRLHAAMDPINNPFVGVAMNLSKMMYGAGGAAIGVILGAALMRLRSKAK